MSVYSYRTPNIINMNETKKMKIKGKHHFVIKMVFL